MTTATDLQADFKTAFLDDPFFGESITYTPSGAAAKTINAVVYRKPFRSYHSKNSGSSGSQQIFFDCEIRISKDATNGIATVTTKEDTVSLAVDIGGAARTWRVGAVIKQDLGAWHLGLV